MSAQPQPDLLSELLAGLKLDSAFFFQAEFSAPWTVRSPPSHEYAPHLSGSASHLIIFHLVTTGEMYVRLEPGSESVQLSPGDVVAFPHGNPHVLGNGPDIHAIEAADTLAHVLTHGLQAARFGSGGEPTGVVCGFMALDPLLGPAILAALPPLLKVNLRRDPSGHWLEDSIRFSVTQAASAGAGAHAVLARLAETLFLETIRRFLQESPASRPAWLAGARDPALGKALALIHRSPRCRWTLASLAREAGLSRSVFAQRFKSSLGLSPMAYLTRWRLQLAARLLTANRLTLAEIAEETGYESEPAFHRAFKREFGLPPARYRAESRARP